MDIKDIENQLFCGDCLDIMEKFPPQSIDMIITSPPYNVGIHYDSHNDNMSHENYLDFLGKFCNVSKRVLKVGGRIAINITPTLARKKQYPPFLYLAHQFYEKEVYLRDIIIWDKSNTSNRMAFGTWKSPANPFCVPTYEFILVFSNQSFRHDGKKENIDITNKEFIDYSIGLWRLPPHKQKNSKDHPCPFPETLVYRLIKLYTYQHDLVLDPFGGSGTTAAVSLKTNRRYIYIDKSQSYYQIAKQRLDTIHEEIKHSLFPHQ